MPLQAFGRVNPGNKTVYLYTLTNPSGAYVRVMPWGATVVGIHVPDRTGTLRDVVLGYDAFDGFAQGRNPSFGSVRPPAPRVLTAVVKLNTELLVGTKHRHPGSPVTYESLSRNGMWGDTFNLVGVLGPIELVLILSNV